MQLGPWTLDRQITGLAWTWRAFDEHGDWATIDIIFGGEEITSRLANAMAANPDLVVHGAERLLGSGPVTPIPNEWRGQAGSGAARWVAREDVAVPTADEPLDAGEALTLAVALRGLLGASLRHAVPIDFSPASVDVLHGGVPYLRRPGLTPATAQPERAALETVRGSAAATVERTLAGCQSLDDCIARLADAESAVPQPPQLPESVLMLTGAGPGDTREPRGGQARRVHILVLPVVVALLAIPVFAGSRMVRDAVEYANLPATEKLLRSIPSAITGIADVANGNWDQRLDGDTDAVSPRCEQLDRPGSEAAIHCRVDGVVDQVLFTRYGSKELLNEAYASMTSGIPDSSTRCEVEGAPEWRRGEMDCWLSPVHGAVLAWTNDDANSLAVATSTGSSLTALWDWWTEVVP